MKGMIYCIYSSQIGGENDKLEDVMEQFSEYVEPTIKIVDQGIGHWECHGQVGFDRDLQPEITHSGTQFFINISINHGHLLEKVLLKIKNLMKDFYQQMDFTADNGEDYPCVSNYELQYCQCPDNRHHNGSILLEIYWELER